MTIYVDADACPVIKQIEELGEKHGIPVVLICDTSHVLKSRYSKVFVVDIGIDSVDLFLINKCRTNDIVVTQDYGVAAMALGKGAYPIHQSGKWFTNENIDQLLFDRHISKISRRSNKRFKTKAIKKRKAIDDIEFYNSLSLLINKLRSVM